MTRAIVVAIVALAAVATIVGAALWRTELRDTRQLLPLRFAHTDHHDVNCVKCHHDFADNTGEGLCIDCHKTNAKVAPEIEPIFHTFCRATSTNGCVTTMRGRCGPVPAVTSPTTHPDDSAVARPTTVDVDDANAGRSDSDDAHGPANSMMCFTSAAASSLKW